MTSKTEVRGGNAVAAIEERAKADGGTVIAVRGYAAVFNQETVIAGLWRERIMPGAFRKAITRDDVFFLVNHDGLPLARTKSGTLKLSEDDHGLLVESELDAEDPDVVAVVRKMKRGDLDKMSFAFMPERQEWDETGDMPLRTLHEVGLHDVSVVTVPAYDGTEIGLRSLTDHRREKAASNFNAAARRLRMKRDLELRVREKG